MSNKVVWFDIPVQDLDRATSFYSAVFQYELQYVDHGENQCAFFPMEAGANSGALVKSPHHSPSPYGTTVYLNGGEDLSIPLSKVEKAGGKVLQEKMSIGEHGFIAYFLDTEGNKVAMHSPK